MNFVFPEKQFTTVLFAKKFVKIRSAILRPSGNSALRIPVTTFAPVFIPAIHA